MGEKEKSVMADMVRDYCDGEVEEIMDWKKSKPFETRRIKKRHRNC